MTDNEFKTKMVELGWGYDYADEIIQRRKEIIQSGLNPPPFEIYLVEAPIND